MAEEKTFRYGFIMLGFFLVMTGMFIMSVEKPQIYITFCALGVLLVAVGITWSMCQCYPKITFIPVDLEAERFLDHKPIVLPDRDTRLMVPCPNQEATSTYEKSLPSYEQIQRQEVGSDPLPPTAQPRPRSSSQPAVQAKAEVHRELGGAGTPPQEPAPRLEMGSMPSSPVPRGRPPPSAACSSCTPTSFPAGGEHPASPRRGTREEDDLYYGLQEGPDTLLEDSDCLFEPEN
ncbi:BSND protein, partial [Burhinus bistriatus]|nr:BSND protein [Burhinus bistriatus]